MNLQWFAMRDLKRPNAKLPGYKQLAEENFEIFTPMKSLLTVRNGRRFKEIKPVIPDLLFVHSTREALDPLVQRIPTLQYRYARGGYLSPMTVADDDMNRFILAVSCGSQPRYFLPDELTPDMYGRMVHIVGGTLNDYTGRLLSLRGSGKKRVIIELPGFLCAAVEVEAEYVELL